MVFSEWMWLFLVLLAIVWFAARVSCPHLEKHNWVEARTKEGLKKEIEKVYECHSRDCRNMDV